MKLKAPEEYWSLTDDQKAARFNGCGSKGSGALVPDTMYGLNITPV